MKHLNKLFIAIILIFALVFNATSCSLIDELGNIGNDNTVEVDGGSGNTDADISSGDNDVIVDTDDTDDNNDSGNGNDNDADNGNNDGGNDSDDDNNDSGNNSNDTDSGDVTITDGGIVLLPCEPDPVTEDPYVGVDVEAFYASYTPAISYMDAYYRTQHNLMSGSIDSQDQVPTVSLYQPMDGDLYVRNTTYVYSADMNTYYVLDAYGEIVNEIYRGAAYVTLEEVAAYVFAFGEPPANHSYSKRTKPTDSPWGIYLRVNHSQFTGSTTKYPYEPELPDISGCGGDLVYYEMDIGTTGTDCDPDYEITDYNNGTKITRGAARIVYTRYDLDGDGVIEVNETYLFYTYNHYNDFQEYLNYEGGWGEMFGNITGGGTLSSKTDYSPTPYVPTAYASFYNPIEAVEISVLIVSLPVRRENV